MSAGVRGPVGGFVAVDSVPLPNSDGTIFVTVRTVPATQWSGALETLELELPESEARVTVELCGPRRVFGSSRRGTEISWPSIGSCDPGDAAAFAELVRLAVSRADGLAAAGELEEGS